MKRTILAALAFLFCVGVLTAQTPDSQGDTGPLATPESFRRAVDVQTSLRELNAAVDDMQQLEALAERVLILDGKAESITVYSEDPNDFYIEVEIVGGRWNGVDTVEMYQAYIFLDDPAFAGRLAERVPRDPDPSLIVRNDRILVAGRLVSLAEDPEGQLVPVLHAYDIRPLR